MTGNTCSWFVSLSSMTYVWRHDVVHINNVTVAAMPIQLYDAAGTPWPLRCVKMMNDEG